jgi:hypothetical protein
MSVSEIEAAIKALRKEDLVQFNQWYQDFLEDQWDEQMRQDVRAGKLDFLLDEARAERQAGTLKPFP